MKTKHFIVTAMLAVVALFFVACTSDDDVAAEGELEQGVVKAEFTISIPQKNGGFTRQGLNIVQGQNTPKFRGMQNIELLPFNSVASGVTGETDIPSMISLGTAESTTLGYTLSSSDMITLASYTADNKVYQSQSRLYKDISVPIGTRSFLFYGVARDSTVTSGSANKANGALTRSESPAKLSDITFTPVPIYEAGTVHQQGSDIAIYLTAIANAKYTSDENTETMLTLFPNFTKINAGSWNSVKAAVQEVYKGIYDRANAGLYKAIADSITKTYTIGGRSVTFASVGSTAGTLTFSTAYTYPQNEGVGLPDGAAYVKWETNKFTAIAQDNLGMNVTPLNLFVYPASLYYYGLSNIKTADVSMQSYYNNSNTWKDILGKYDAAEGFNTLVQSTTRSIAIEDEVQYAVGRLDVTVTTKSGSAELRDNDNNVITIGNNFPITGIIVGNQRPVDYKFETSTSSSNYTIYDSEVKALPTSDVVPYLYPGTNSPSTTHTLVLETPATTLSAPTSSSEEEQSDVNADVPIAVEFMNNSSQTIVGKDKMVIYPNTKFYLIGTLKPYKNTTQKYKGTSTNINQAFVKDYVTTANFVVESFQNAYNMLPDLRTPKLEIGMSVDLTWEDGITQTITIK